ncbi:MAG: hypothetical protein WC966_09755 [Bradymonadales bacterium]|jgi:hypothetical protein
MKNIFFSLTLIIGFTLTLSQARAQEILLYSYESFFYQDKQEWALLPIPTAMQLPNSDAEKAKAVFEKVKSRKLPSYGNTQLKDNTVTIDPQKCDFAPLIAAELSLNFEWLGLKRPQILCAAKSYREDFTQFTRFVPLQTTWKAASSEISANSYVEVNHELLSSREFRARLERKDKSIVADLERSLQSDNRIAKASLISVYPSLNLPRAEERVAEFLNDSDELLVLASVKALKASDKPAIVQEIRGKFNQNTSLSRALQEECLDGANFELTRAAIIAEIKTNDAVRIENALQSAEKHKELSFLCKSLPEFYALSAKNFETLYKRLLSAGLEAELAKQLSPIEAPAMLLGIARSIVQNKSAALNSKNIAHSFILQHASAVEAAKSYRALTGDKSVKEDHIARALYQKDRELREHAIDLLISRKSSNSADLLAKAAESITEFAPNFEWAMAKMMPAQARLSASLKSEKNSHKQRAMIMATQRQIDEKWLDTLGKNTHHKGAALIALAAAKSENPWLKEQAKTALYSSDYGLRRDLAFALRFMDHSDEYASELIKDTEASIVNTSIESMRVAGRSDFAQKLIQNAKGAPKHTRLSSLANIAALIDKKNEKNILSFVSNEAFDSDIEIKLAAISSLSQIVSYSQNSEIRENALLSLALTAKDPKPEISTATLAALAKTQSPQALAPIKEALTQNENIEAVLDAIEIYPSKDLILPLNAWIHQNSQSPELARANSLLEQIQK